MKRPALSILLVLLLLTVNSCKKTTLDDASTTNEGSVTPATEQRKPCCDTITIVDDTATAGIKEVQITPEIIQPAKPIYSIEMLENKVEGFVNLKLLVGTDGNVKEYVIMNDLGHGTNEAIHKALLNMKFSPARKDKTRVAVWVDFTMNFKCPNLPID